MQNITNCKKIETAIRRAKKMLCRQAKETGIYENFGQNEVRMIDDKFIDISIYTREMNQSRLLLECFNRWCMNFNDSSF